ncbi:Glyoxylate reductase [Lachnellula suecica]|uniref:Glyoxylate reductase n=1 Tax=Lachnellula suecica TaxID=602035 RepID=A0A8T9C2U9_9HELO|nr:Glyoxylate reductase [Lachnellula suecica]
MAFNHQASPIFRALRTKARQKVALGIRSYSVAKPKLPSLAIIDDYLNTSAPHFSHISPSQLQITTFNETIAPVNDAELDRLVERLTPFDVISTMRERTAFPATLLRRLPNLKLLLATGTQFETFDLAAARELGISIVAAPGLGRTDQAGQSIHNIKKGNAHPTTQHTWALILALARNVAADDAAIKASTGWQSGLATGLAGLTLGTVGLGRLGAAVARVAHLAWGMRVICWSENLTQQKADEMAAAVGLPLENDSKQKTFHAVSKEELFRSSDVVSMHYVLSERSRGIVGARELELMKKSALLVNTARGPLINQEALLDTLENGRIRGAALDVFDIEPLPPSSPWRRSNYWGQHGRSALLTTPHMGYVDERLMNAWYAESAENAERWLQGKESVITGLIYLDELAKGFALSGQMPHRVKIHLSGFIESEKEKTARKSLFPLSLPTRWSRAFPRFCVSANRRLPACNFPVYHIKLDLHFTKRIVG